MKWSGIPRIATIPIVEYPGKSFVKVMAESLKETLNDMLC